MAAPADAPALLGRLLDGHERQPARTRPPGERAPDRFATPDARASFERTIRAAEAAGAVAVVMGRGELRHLMARVTLRDPGALYRFLGRTPRAERARSAADALRERLEPALRDGVADELDAVAAAWESGRVHRQLPLGAVDDAADYLLALHAVRGRDPGDSRDLRTFSRQATGDSKRIERHAARLVGALRDAGLVPPDLPRSEALAALGLEKFEHPVLVGGALAWSGVAIPPGRYLGVHPRELERLAPASTVDVLLTVENFASFNRQVEEATGPGQIVVFTGGWPSRAVVRALRRLCPPARRVRHWGDIDLHGALIADYLWRTVDRRLALHLMGPALARGGPAPAPGRVPSVDPASPAAPLIAFLAGPDAAVFEQEELDPVSPAAD